MTDPGRLARRLERERAARREAERIAEQTTRELYERNQELTLLESIAAAANQAASVNGALDEALQRLCRHLHWPTGHAWLLDDATGRLMHTAVAFVSQAGRFDAFTELSARHTFGPDEGLPGRVLTSNVAHSIDDVVGDANFPRAAAAQAAGLHGAIAFPISVEDGVVAVLECFTEEPTHARPQMLRVLEQAGRQIGRVFERDREQRRLQHQATHDALTGLPNRVLFQDRLEQTLAAARRDGRSCVAVMLIDLDRFKEVNDTLGHRQGDALLRTVGERLSAVLRESDTIARLGGDEFGLLLPNVDGEEGAREVAARLQEALAEPLQFDGVLVQVDASVGTALYPLHGHDAEALVRQADVGMYEAKRSHAGHAFYASERDPYSAERLGMVANLRRALDAGELVLHYQPKIDVQEGVVRGVEALVRWPDPEGGLIPPGEFIPVAERTGLIRPMTTFVLRTALAQARAWADGGLHVPIAVNLSARSLLDTAFPDHVARLLAEAGVEPGLLELEVTESMMLEDPARSLDVLTRLDSMGIALSVDDFGTGYSSLAQLKRLPVRELKIDRGFVGSMRRDDRDAFIVRSSIQLGHNLGLRVVAEGVEDGETLAMLDTLGCDSIQGYLVKRPSPADELTEWLGSFSAVDASALRAATAG